MNWRPYTSLVLRYVLVAILVVGALYEGVSLMRNRQAPAGQCSLTRDTMVLTVFFKPAATLAQQQDLVASFPHSTEEHYAALHALSLKVPASAAAQALHRVRNSPLVVSSSSSPEQRCQDPD